MKIYKFKDKKYGGSWILILGCPLPEKHNLHDRATGKTGPSFSQCARCEHQIGSNFEILGADDNYDGARIFPDRLLCRRLELDDIVTLLIEQDE